MELEYKRMSDENIEDYVWRICDNKTNGKYDLTWEQVADILNETVEDEYTSSRWRKNYQMMKKGYDRAVVKNTDSNDAVEEIKIAKQELYKERVKNNDEKNELRALLREDARISKIGEKIDDAFERILTKKIRSIPDAIITNKKKQAVASIADVHWGTEFKIEGFFGDTIAEYNTDIIKSRFWQLRDSVLDFCRTHNIDHISLVELGDSVNGIIHLSGIQANKGDVVDAIVDYTDFFIDFIDDLSKHITMDIYTSTGNHSDLKILSEKRLFRGENLEKIFARSLSKSMRNNPNVEVVSNNNGMNYFDVLGTKVFTVHGQNEKNLLNSIREYEEVYNLKDGIDILMVGHLHSKKEIDVNGGKEVMQVRSIMGGNDYSILDLKKISPSGASIFSIEEGYGKKDIRDIKFTV